MTMRTRIGRPAGVDGVLHQYSLRRFRYPFDSQFPASIKGGQTPEASKKKPAKNQQKDIRPAGLVIDRVEPYCSR